jgi:hypothetical protein
MLDSELITAHLEPNKVVIEIPLELLKFAQENREYMPFKINDVNKLGQWVADNVLDWGGNQDTGSTAFEDILDGVTEDAYSLCEDWLEAAWDEDF